MRRAVVISLLHFGFAAIALQTTHLFAQEANPYKGTWAVQFDVTDRVAVTGTVEVNDRDGLWKIPAYSRKDQCVGRDAPIVVQSATPDKLVFRVMRSQALAGCQDFTVTMNRVDDNNLQGAFHNGTKVQMKRQ